LNVTSRDVIWQPCSNGLILIKSLIWLGDPSPPGWGRDSSDLTCWRAAGLTAVSFCLWDCSDTHVDHVIQCLISLSVIQFGLWISFESRPISPIPHRVELIGRLHWLGIAPINTSESNQWLDKNKSNCVSLLRLSQYLSNCKLTIKYLLCFWVLFMLADVSLTRSSLNWASRCKPPPLVTQIIILQKKVTLNSRK
jgi:hypothetical protein